MTAALVIVAVLLLGCGARVLWHRAVPPRRLVRLTREDLIALREDLPEP